MVSLLTPTDRRRVAPIGARWEQRLDRLRLRDDERFHPFPSSAGMRWALRALFALPFLALTIWQLVARPAPTATPNHELLDRVARIDWASADVTWIHDLFPPFSTLYAAIVPGSAFGVSIVGALSAGYLLQRMLEIMAQRGYPPVTVALLMLAIGANPLTAYTATQNFAGFLGLTLFGLGMADVYRFVVWGHTQAGFRAGIQLMLAVLSAPEAPLYVLIAALTTPFLVLGRHRDSKRVRSSQVIVVVFPALAAIASLTGLAWIFTGDPLAVIGRSTFDGIPERWAHLGEVFTSIGGVLLILTVLSAWAVGIIVRRPGAIIVSSLLFVGILVAFVVGFLPASSAGNTFIMMMMLAISVLPIARGIGRIAAVNVVALCQIVIAWATALNRDVVLAWLQSLGLG